MEVVDESRVVRSLQAAVDRSPYFYYVFRHVAQVGFRIGDRVFVLEMDVSSGRARLSLPEGLTEPEPELWVDVNEGALLEADGTSPVPTTVTRSRRGENLPKALEEILARCFDVSRTGPAAIDREELVYGPLFSFRPPQTLLCLPDGVTRVLLYREGIDGLTACVTSGFTNPEMERPALGGERHLPGFGYELIILCQGEVPVLCRELVGWAQYVLNHRQHIVRGNWLEYEEGIIPQTDLGGFLIVAPATFPASFPLSGGRAEWNLLLGVTPAESSEAKRSGVVPVAQKLFEHGYRDWSPPRRAPVQGQ